MMIDNKKQEEGTNIHKFFEDAKNYVMSHGYKEEIEWCKQRKPLEYCDAETFFLEYVYVVLNAGMKEQVARKIYEKFCKDFDINTIRHPGKRKAIDTAIENYTMWFILLKLLQNDNDKIEYLAELPWIGNITKYHLARNIGIDTVKPDRHLVRIAEQFNFKTPLDMCIEIQKTTKERLGVIDVIIWRYCNLCGSTGRKPHETRDSYKVMHF